MTVARLNVRGRVVEISSLGKILLLDDGFTKLDIAEYYVRIAGTALPHYRDRHVTMQRFPDGIEAEGLFRKNVPDHFPDRIDRLDLPKGGGTVTHAVVKKAAALVYLADHVRITPHRALARSGTPRQPDRMVFDLDPSVGDFGKLQDVARAVRDALEARDLPSIVATTRSRGLHIVLPLDASVEVDRLRPFARRLAQDVAAAHLALATVGQRKAWRGDRVLIDTFRTAYAQTAAAPCALRARPGAPVATPLLWEEALAPDMAPD